VIVFFLGMRFGGDPPEGRDGENLTPVEAQRQLMAVEKVIETPCPVDEVDPDVVAVLERHGLAENGDGIVKPTAAAIYYARLIEVA
jgi:hypothetical protein